MDNEDDSMAHTEYVKIFTFVGKVVHSGMKGTADRFGRFAEKRVDSVASAATTGPR